MKIGVCVGDSIEKAKLCYEAGFDYVEGHCQQLTNMDEDAFNELISLPIPFYSANCFIGLRVVGKEKNEKAIGEYTEKLFDRAQKAGIKVLVFGSSGARKTEGEITVAKAREEIADFLKKYVAPKCEKTGIYVAIEPLRKEECDVINTVAQGIDIAKKTGSPYIKVLCDVKHMIAGDDPISVIPEYNNWLIHAHTSNPKPDPSLGKKRIYPTVNDAFNQDIFFKPLIEAGIDHCTIEADVIDFPSDVKNAYEVLKKYQG